MAIFGKNGFVRRQEVNFAAKLIVWKYEKSGIAVPSAENIRAQAEKIVDEAHEIAKDSGSTVMTIVKESIENIRKKSR